jgi:hypothetical protein
MYEGGGGGAGQSKCISALKVGEGVVGGMK